MKQCRDINELTPTAQAACKLFLKKCKEQGVNIFIVETYRSQARQNELYEQGRTKLWDKDGKPLKIVTWTRNSRHTSRRAWDIACKGKELYNIAILNKAGKIAKFLGIIWGGEWETPDKVHFEIAQNWKEPEVEEVEKRYNTVEEVPEWGKETIKQLINEGCFADPKRLNLSEDMIRVFVVLKRKDK